MAADNPDFAVILRGFINFSVLLKLDRSH